MSQQPDSDDLKKLAEKLFSGGFKSSQKRLEEEEKDRALGNQRAMSFGVTFLDDALGGINQSDLIVFGARSGVGKTELLTHIAQTVSKGGGRVHYFALEAEAHEIERRVRYKHVANLFFKDPEKPRGITLKYRYWRSNSLAFYLEPYEEKAKKLSLESMMNIQTYYKDEESDQEFTIDTFEEKLGKIKGQTDFIIIDHLNYFDKRSDKNTDEVFQIMKTIRGHALRLGVPVILATQVRKRDKRDPSLVPDMEEIFGSSDVYKIATKVVMFAPNEAAKGTDNRLFETFMRCQKMRQDSSVARYIGITQFDSAQNCYLPDYKVALAYKFDHEFENLVGEQLPDWARPYIKAYEKNPEYGRPYKDD